VLVISMLVIALIGAFIVFTKDAVRESENEKQTAESAGPIQWLNISSSDAVDPECCWVSQIWATLPQDDIELTNLATPGATAGQLAQLLASGDPGVEVDVATVWIGSEDFLAGTQILEFEEHLAAILSWLISKRATILVGNLPDLTAELVAARLAELSAVHPVFDQWNASIARLTTSFGGTSVDLNQPLDPSRSPIRYLYSTYFDPNAEAQSFVAKQFSEALDDALTERPSSA
jgi:hypothetical protein